MNSKKAMIKKTTLGIKMPDYDEVSTTMMTLMIFPKEKYPMRDLFLNMEVTTTETAKNRKGNPVKKDLCLDGSVPDGVVFSCSYGNLSRGTTLAYKKGWCKDCKLYTEKTLRSGEKTKKKNLTMKRIFEVVTEIDSRGKKTKCMITKFKCEVCEQTFLPKDAKSLTTFPTQIGIYFSRGSYYLHAMIFRKKQGDINSIKIAGCKDYSDGKAFVDFLYYKTLYAKKLLPITPTQMTINGTLRNKKFSLPFSVDREKLVEIMSRPEYSDLIENATFVPEVQTAAYIQMKPQKKYREIYELTLDQKRSKGEIKKILAPATTAKKPEAITFIVFTSSSQNPGISIFQVTGKDFLSHKKCYDFFVKVVSENKNYIEEVFE